MENSAAFYQNFFQFDTLFRVAEEEILAVEPVIEPEVEDPSVEEVSTEIAEVLLISEQELEDQESEAVVSAPEVIVPEVEPEWPQVVVPFPSLKHKILVLVEEKSQPDLKPDDALLLENILKATGHSIDEVDILNISTLPKADARAVVATKRTHYFITFGVPLIKLQIDLLFQPYTPRQIEGIWFLLAEPLSVIDADKSKKKQLWLALKEMFAVS